MRKNKLLLLLALLMTAATGAMAQDYYAPSTDEVIILNEVYNASNSGYSSHSAIAWGGSASPSNKKAGDPNNDGGLSTSSTVSCYSVKGTGQGKNITLSITGVSTVIVYHEKKTGRYIELRDGSKGGNIIGSGESSTYCTEVALTATNKYSIFLHGTSNGSDDQDLYVYAIKLIAAPAAPAAAGYTVTVKDGVKDADKWTISPNPAPEGSPVTIQYTGRLKVKGVTATSDEKPAEASVPDGAINGKFSVSSTKKVYFSKGNLRYASSKWSFFDNQYDYYTSYSADAWDHFGWSTSATTYGMSTSSNNDDYSGDFVDWGATMGAGWRTLTSDEWAYLLKTRSASTVNGTENGRYAKAKVNNVPGIILFPDTYTHPAGVEAPTGVNATDEYGWEGNSYTAADWTKMESAGCVFLPAAGCRYGSEMIGLGSYGYYGSATPDGADYAYRVKFNSGSLEPANSINRCLGCSVRLVQEVAPNP